MTVPNLGPTPTDPVELALYNFLSNSNWGNLHSSDWDQFYRFVILAFREDRNWDCDDVRQRLRNYGMREDRAIELSSAYEHALLTLKTYVDGSDKIARFSGQAI